MERRQRQITAKNTGRIKAISRARRHWMQNMIASAPTIVTAEIKRSSGP